MSIMNLHQDDAFVLAGRFLEQNYIKSNPPELQRLIVTLYRLMLCGWPVELQALAKATGYDEQRVGELLELVPQSAYDRSQAGEITAFIGLSTTPTRHRLVTGGVTLYTWCAFDALFLPGLLAISAEICSDCPTSGTEIKIRFDSGRLKSATPSDLVLSFVTPDLEAYGNDLRGEFCCHVNFFANSELFAKWAEGKDNMGAVTVAEALELANQRNADRFPDIIPLG
jgi:alkylmercury lyase